MSGRSAGRRAVRTLRPADAVAARALVSAGLDGTRFAQRTHEVLDAALAGGDDEEHIGLVLAFTDAEAGAAPIAAVAAIGAVAGASGAWRLHWLFAHHLDDARQLASAVIAEARNRGARLIVCELPDDASFALARHGVADAGFVLEGRVPNFVRDGVDLQLWVRRC